MIQLSILIPSVPSRFVAASLLFQDICEQLEGLDFEVIILTDNKKRSIGEKRENLKNLANGKYWMIIDDDDSVKNLRSVYNATFFDKDVITFQSECKNADGSTYIVTSQLGNPIEHNTLDGNYLDSKRPPFHFCAWNSRFKSVHFPFIGYGEDGVWAKKANKKAKTSFHIEKVIHYYNFNPATTEAPTESNPYWTNPNEETSNSKPGDEAV